jgi:hypothetical protein
MKTIDVEIMDTNGKISFSELKIAVHNIKKKTNGNRCKPKVIMRIRCIRRCTTVINQGVLQWMKLHKN